jgi:hypothetical protein
MVFFTAVDDSDIWTSLCINIMWCIEFDFPDAGLSIRKKQHQWSNG